MAQHASKTERGTTEPPAGRSPLQTVVVHGSDIRVDRAHAELPLAEARSRFGGVDVPAVLAGALAGLGTLVLLGAAASAAGTQIGRPQQVDDGQLALGGAITGLVALALCALLAGWVAGRVARFDGMRNGLLTGLALFLLVLALGAAGGYAATEATTVTLDVDRDQLTTAALVAGLVGLAVSLLAGALGGRLGARWHRSVDDLVVGTRPGAVAPSSSEQVVR